MVDDIGLEQIKLDMRPKLVPWISRPERPQRRHAADAGAKNCNCNNNFLYIEFCLCVSRQTLQETFELPISIVKDGKIPVSANC